MAVYVLRCSGTVCGGVNVLGSIELPDGHLAPEAAGWGYLCVECVAAWRMAIAADAAAAVTAHRPAAHPATLAPLGAPRMPAVHPGGA